MVAGKRFEPPDLVGATFSGVVTAADQAEAVDWVHAAIRHLGSVRVLIVLEHFAGWLPGSAVYNHLAWLSDDERVSKIAVVGRPEWRSAVLTLAALPIRQTPIRYFETETEARQWLGVGEGKEFDVASALRAWRRRSGETLW
jgi:hypothetical protein